MTGLHIEIAETPQGVIARLSGEAGLGAADALQFPLLRLTAQRPPLVVFDLAQLVLVASLFMGALVNFRRGVMRHGCRVRLAGLRPEVREAFCVAGLDQLFDIKDTVDEALGV